MHACVLYTYRMRAGIQIEAYRMCLEIDRFEFREQAYRLRDPGND